MNTSPSKFTHFFHPAAGVLILLLDWCLFSGTVLSLGLSTIALSTLGLVLGTIGTTWIQGRYAGDRRGARFLKGILAGIVVGLPLPIAGTAGGAAILALSGLDRFTGRASPPTTDDRSVPGDDAPHR